MSGGPEVLTNAEQAALLDATPAGLLRRPFGMTDDDYRELRRQAMRRRQTALEVLTLLEARGIQTTPAFINWYDDVMARLAVYETIDETVTSDTPRRIRRKTRPPVWRRDTR